MNVMIVGGKHYSDRGYIIWYLDILHDEGNIDGLVFMIPANTGTYKIAKDWADLNKVNYIEFPSIESKFLDYTKEIDCAVCFPASYSSLATSGKIRQLAEDLGIPILDTPKADGK